jgi:DNA adenine methylase
MQSTNLYSLFRYPGGKTWLVPCMRAWLASLGCAPVNFCEPFAGGGSIGLTIVFENLANRVIFAEIDPDVASVWRTVLGRNASWLANRINTFELSEQSVRTVLASAPKSLRERAFQTILRNRVNYGGILAPGAGILRSGENGKGLRSRWYPRTLEERILRIAGSRNKIGFFEADGLEIMRAYQQNEETVWFLDPPYADGARLYRYFDVSPRGLFELAHGLNGDFLMTYHDDLAIRNLVDEFEFQVREVAMRDTHHRDQHELLISRNLLWMN